ncbi:SurA N-terminal domain-containing protein [Amphritea japonica]|uniref:Periplasmic chaperone PpiD n=1 Tax=Amphritea japonica ATCC BAA-1530 TaxID=1278309 RepID=A0A7R6PDD6_9GAMM|nr:SurA N-terminal domain-containing protein [Amphritea japonica]BBB26051.1 peptidyl-prolyl cis-trans isomerase D [Amphritea japonica ATCC BAA-1530]
MLQNIRDNSKGIVAKIIVGLIAVTFALFGVESLVSLTGGSNAPATVNGVEISERDLLQGADLQRRQLLAQMGENADPTLLDDNLIRKATLDNLIQQEVLVQSAVSQDMAIADQALDQMIINTSDFQVEGQFNRDQYAAVLRNAGLTPMMYKELLRKESLIGYERSGYLLSGFSLEQEAERIISLDRETRDLAYVQVALDDYKQGVSLTAEDLSAYYADHQSEFMTDEQVVIEYLLINKTDLLKQVTVDDAELQSQFDQVLASFESAEQRTVSHIMIEVSDQVDDAAALAKAEKLAERLASGEAFAALAESESDDPGSAPMGGDLGVYQQGLLDGPFESAVYALNVGEVSEPVRTSFGYHLITLTELTASEAPVFDDVKDQLIAEQMDNKVEQLYVEKVGQLTDLSFSAGDLQEPAEELQLTIIEAPAFGSAGGNDDITANARVIRTAFNEELIRDGLNSDPIELDSGRTLVLRVKEHIRPRQLSEEEVSEQITEVLVVEKAGEALQASLEAELEKLKQGGERVAINGAEWAVAEAVTRADRSQSFEVMTTAFKMPKPESGASYSLITLQNGAKAIVAVTAVSTPDLSEITADERKGMRAVLGQRAGQFDYQAMTEARKSAAEIEKL